MKYESMFARLVANTSVDPEQNENGCWLWTGKTCRRGEYGHINVRVAGKHKTLKAHRVMFEEVHGVKLTEEQTVDHLCASTLCIHPDHLDPVPISREENSRRSQARNPR
jgi:hypothetical protein